MSEKRLRVEWNLKKAERNLRKHGVSFQEASTVFEDPYAFVRPDETHSDDEDRQIIIGTSKRNRLLFVVFIEIAINFFRLISARKTTSQERQTYEEADQT